MTIVTLMAIIGCPILLAFALLFAFQAAWTDNDKWYRGAVVCFVIGLALVALSYFAR